MGLFRPVTFILLIKAWETASITDNRNFRRHTNPPQTDWDLGLRESAHQALLREHYTEPSLRHQLLEAPFIGRHDSGSPFGDIAVLARGQLYVTDEGLKFLQDSQENCSECHLSRCVSSFKCHRKTLGTHHKLLALWTVKRIRHRDPNHGHVFEIEYTISPITAQINEEFVRQQGSVNYNVPGHIFVIRSDSFRKKVPSKNDPYVKPGILIGVTPEGMQHVLHSYPGFFTSYHDQTTVDPQEYELYKKLIESLASKTSTHRFSATSTSTTFLVPSPTTEQWTPLTEKQPTESTTRRVPQKTTIDGIFEDLFGSKQTTPFIGSAVLEVVPPTQPMKIERTTMVNQQVPTPGSTIASTVPITMQPIVSTMAQKSTETTSTPKQSLTTATILETMVPKRTTIYSTTSKKPSSVSTTLRTTTKQVVSSSSTQATTRYSTIPTKITSTTLQPTTNPITTSKITTSTFSTTPKTTSTTLQPTTSPIITSKITTSTFSTTPKVTSTTLQPTTNPITTSKLTTSIFSTVAISTLPEVSSTTLQQTTIPMTTTDDVTSTTVVPKQTIGTTYFTNSMDVTTSSTIKQQMTEKATEFTIIPSTLAFTTTSKSSTNPITIFAYHFDSTTERDSIPSTMTHYYVAYENDTTTTIVPGTTKDDFLVGPVTESSKKKQNYDNDDIFGKAPVVPTTPIPPTTPKTESDIANELFGSVARRSKQIKITKKTVGANPTKVIYSNFYFPPTEQSYSTSVSIEVNKRGTKNQTQDLFNDVALRLVNHARGIDFLQQKTTIQPKYHRRNFTTKKRSLKKFSSVKKKN